MVVIAMFAVIAYGFFAWFPRRMLYPAPLTRVGAPPPAFTAIQLNGVEAWHHEPAHLPPTSPVILYCHGNGENLETMRQAGMLDMLTGMGYPVLVFDFPGYGNSRGRPSEHSLVKAASTYLDWLDQRYPKRPKIVWGHSLGAGVAIQTAARHPNLTQGLILMSPFDTVLAVAARYAPQWVGRLLLSDRYNSLEASTRVECPTFIIHGEEDWIIPISHGRSLANAFGPRAEWTALPKLGHNDIVLNQTAIERVAKFIWELQGHQKNK